MNEWKKVKLKDCVKEVNERTSENNQYEVLTSSKSGIYSQEDYFDKQVASKDNVGYKIIKRGQFTYRSMSDNGTFTINRLENKDIGIVSPAYPVFEATDINAEYLKYFFQSERFRKEIYNLSQGSTRTALKYKDLSNIDILLPPIEEQEKIVKTLKKLDFIIEKYRNILEEKNKLIKSQFVDIFGKDIYEVVKLNDVCDVRDGTHDSPSYLSYSPYKFITSKNLVDGKISFENVKYIEKKDYDKFNERSKVNYGDILMPMIGTIGNPVIVDIKDEQIDFAIKNVALIKFYQNTKVNNIYIKSLLMSNSFNKMIELTKKGGTQQFVALKDIRNFNIKLPPIKLQNSFAEIVQQIEKQKLLLEQQKQNYQNLRKGLMQKLLTGKVRVKI